MPTLRPITQCRVPLPTREGKRVLHSTPPVRAGIQELLFEGRCTKLTGMPAVPPPVPPRLGRHPPAPAPAAGKENERGLANFAARPKGILKHHPGRRRGPSPSPGYPTITLTLSDLQIGPGVTSARATSALAGEHRMGAECAATSLEGWGGDREGTPAWSPALSPREDAAFPVKEGAAPSCSSQVEPASDISGVTLRLACCPRTHAAGRVTASDTPVCSVAMDRSSPPSSGAGP
jgi:hypothetical protein